MFAIYSCFGHNTINYSRIVCLVGGVRVYLQEKCIYIVYLLQYLKKNNGIQNIR